ncbi:MAG: MBOAT family protein [Deltaproteobacteria bacterium]|nr:MBOAT family protein [Deltaproteobacteria bacterium]
MLFHSVEFFFLFSGTFIGFWLIPHHRLRMLWLLGASFGFYGSWNPWLMFVVVFSAAFDFLIAQRIEASPSPKARRFLLIVSICVSLGILGFFKYTNFLLDSAVSTFNFFGFDYRHPAFRIVLPLGISFYTFETISYVMDVYRGRLRAERNFLDYALFIMFFPLGLVKKALIADQMPAIVDPVFASPSDFSTEAVWIAVFCYATQIYCDFSGYSDMALGTAHAFGFKLPQNFNLPYAACNITEFWRRWHISLSTWLRDYLYIPLGGNRHGTAATYRNLILTMLLGGLWHGAGWSFVFWGLYHGSLLAVHRVFASRSRPIEGPFKPVRIAFTFLCVCIGWVLFRAESMTDAWLILRRMFTLSEGQTFETAEVAIALAAWTAVILGHLVSSYIDMRSALRWLPAPVIATGMAVVFLLVQVLMPHRGGAFIYFQF